MTFQKVLSEKSEKELLVEYEDGWTPHELTIIYRISLRTVYRILSRNNVRKQKNRKYKYGTGRRKTPKPKELKPCGTDAAYQRHRKAKEYPCTQCLEAHAAAVKVYKEKSKKRGKNRTLR